MNNKIKTPLVSIIIATYNRASLIVETINSILIQTYNNIELIVVDDGSTDCTEKIVESFHDNRINYFKTENWGGPARPRNIGIENAKGKYIAFCDDDDLWLPDKLEKQLKFLSEYNVVGIGSNSELIGDTTLFRKRSVSTLKDVKTLGFKDMINGHNVCLSSLVILNEKTKYSEDRNLLYVEDWDYQIQLTMTGKKIGLMPDILVKYRQPAIDENYPKKSANIIHVINKYRQYYSESEYHQKLCNYFRYMAIRYLKARDKKNAILNLKRAISSCNINIYMRIIVIWILPITIINFVMKAYYKNYE